MKQQTAVEWLVYVVQSNIAPNYIPKEIVEQAKEMEEQQMFEFWNGGIDCTEGGVCFDQYYNETFKNK
jgi:hypothetical protein